MPEKLSAMGRLGLEVLPGLALQDVRVSAGNGVPDLGGPLVDIVERGKIQVFFVPTKKSLPASNIAVGLGYAFDALGQAVLEEGVQSV